MLQSASRRVRSCAWEGRRRLARLQLPSRRVRVMTDGGGESGGIGKEREVRPLGFWRWRMKVRRLEGTSGGNGAGGAVAEEVVLSV